MSDWTPTMEQIKTIVLGALATAADRRGWERTPEKDEADFDRAIAQHEADLRTQIADDIRAHATEIADTRLHAKGAIPYITGIHEAADIAEEGTTK